MRVLFATSEIFPHVKTGGLGDVCASLPIALAKKGEDVRLFLPGYPEIMKNLSALEYIQPVHFAGADDLSLVKGTLPNGLVTYALASKQFYERTGPYVDSNGLDWADNHLRFGAFSFAAANLYLYDRTWTPDIIHLNDWPCGLVPAYLSQHHTEKPKTLMTIHNLAYQGLFPADTMSELQLSPDLLDMDGLDHWGKISFMKAGLYYSDHLSTVSPTYAKEIQTTEFGCGLESLIKSRASHLTGILNGIDNEIWNPATDPHVANCYDSSTLDKKENNKRDLLKSLGLPITDNPVFAVVSRLTSQKGFDLLLKSVPFLLAQKAYLVLLGSGDKDIEDQFKALARKHPEQVAANVEYEEPLAHCYQSGADAIVVPSRFEPCGLVQMYGLRYGTVPVVRKTGGLADSVIDAGTPSGTGVVFDKACPDMLEDALRRTIKAFRNQYFWRKLQRNAMAQEFSWKASSEKYIAVYKGV